MRRLATENDLEQVYAIYMHPSVIPFLSHDPMPLEAFREVYRELHTSGDFYIYEQAGEIAGFYRTTRYSARVRHVACLGTLAVNPQWQGRGIGQEMIADAVARLAAEGVKRVELFVEADNPRAISFYQRLGFEIEGTLRAFYKRADSPDYVDEHVMARLLP